MAKETTITNFVQPSVHLKRAQEIFPSKVILLRKKATGKIQKKKCAKETQEIRMAVGLIPDVVSEWVEKPEDLEAVARKVISILNAEKTLKNEITIHIGGSDEFLSMALLLCAYTRPDKIARIIYTPKGTDRMIYLPKAPFVLSGTRRRLLGLVQEYEDKTKCTAITAAKKLGKTRAVVHGHLVKLRNQGLIDKDYNMTDAGRIALL